MSVSKSLQEKYFNSSAQRKKGALNCFDCYYFGKCQKIKGYLEQPHGMNLNQFEVSLSSLHVRGVWVFTREPFIFSSLLGLIP